MKSIASQLADLGKISREKADKADAQKRIIEENRGHRTNAAHLNKAGVPREHSFNPPVDIESALRIIAIISKKRAKEKEGKK